MIHVKELVKLINACDRWRKWSITDFSHIIGRKDLVTNAVAERVRYDAFPGHTHGIFRGQVIEKLHKKNI